MLWIWSHSSDCSLVSNDAKKRTENDFLALSMTVSSGYLQNQCMFTAPAAPIDSSTIPTPESVKIETVAYPNIVPTGSQ